jgi:hypothetical protein
VTLEEAICKAVEQGDAHAAGVAADYMRFELGWNYQRSFGLVQRVCTQVTLATWDALLREADETE